jgi:hypothetical protein
MQRTLNMIELQGYDEEEEKQGPLLIDPPPPAIQQVMILHEQAPAPQQDIPPQAMPPDEAAMCISAAAYSGSPSDSTISLLLNFSKAQAVAFVDTGSTSTFMDLTFAQKHKIPLTTTTERTVTVAGGGILSSGFIAYNCPFTVQGTKFVTNFRILELQGADVILGVNWFKQHNLVTFEFLERKLTIGVQEKILTFHDHLLPTDKLLISLTNAVSCWHREQLATYCVMHKWKKHNRTINLMHLYLMLLRNYYYNSVIYLRHQRDCHLLENKTTTFPY